MSNIWGAVQDTLKLSQRLSKEALTLKRINFNIQHGEIFGFLGPSGSEKTTIQKVLIGMLKVHIAWLYLGKGLPGGVGKGWVRDSIR